MAKGEQKSNREIKKPKKEKPAPAPTGGFVTKGQSAQTGTKKKG